MFAPWRFRSPFEPSFATPALSRWRRTSRNGIVGGAAVGLLALDGPGYLLSEAAPALQERPMIDDDLPQPGRWMSDVRCIPMRWKSGFSRKMPTPTRRPSTPFGDELPAERQIERLKAASIAPDRQADAGQGSANTTQSMAGTSTPSVRHRVLVIRARGSFSNSARGPRVVRPSSCLRCEGSWFAAAAY